MNAVFFPDKGGSARFAKRVCSTCAFREPCAEWSLHVAVEGVWGGLSGEDRIRIRKARRIVAEPIVPPENSADRRRLRAPTAARAEAVRRLTAAGLSAAEIAARLKVTPRTVTRLRSEQRRAAA